MFYYVCTWVLFLIVGVINFIYFYVMFCDWDSVQITTRSGRTRKLTFTEFLFLEGKARGILKIVVSFLLLLALLTLALGLAN